MYAYTKVFPTDNLKDFDFLECLLFGALISATDPGKFLVFKVRRDVYYYIITILTSVIVSFCFYLQSQCWLFSMICMWMLICMHLCLVKV